MKSTFSLAFLLLIGSSFQFEDVNKLTWVSKNAATVTQLIPAGKEANLFTGEKFTLYVGRAMHKGQWIPGKAGFKSSSKTFYFDLVYQGKQIFKNDFQLLVQPLGATSWVEAEGSVIPSHPVVGGTDPDSGESTFICRALITYPGSPTYLVLGKLFPSSGECHLSYEKEYVVSKYEVLVKNEYGVYIDV